jgi:hypothetical protein
VHGQAAFARRVKARPPYLLLLAAAAVTLFGAPALE